MMAKALTRRERRRICRDYYKATRKGWMDRIRRAMRHRNGGEPE